MRSILSSLHRIGSVAALTVASLAMVGCGPQNGSTPATVATTTNPPATTSAAPVGQAVPPAPVGQPVPLVNNNIQAQAPNDGTPPYVPPSPTPSPPPVQSAQATAPAVQPAPQPQRRVVSSAFRGEVSSIEPIRERPPGSGAGAVLGGVLGAVVGNQFGHGNGRAAMTVVGAAGGAVAGNNVERNINKRVIGYRVSVRLDNGQSRTYQETRVDNLRVGDRVRIEGSHVRRG
jgi:outer membrane lipoprotein SlyB